jgi:hypothetical protein
VDPHHRDPDGPARARPLLQGQDRGGPRREPRPLRLSGADGRRHPDLQPGPGAGGAGPEAAPGDDPRHRRRLQPRLRPRGLQAPRAAHPGGRRGGARDRREEDEQVLRQHDPDVRPREGGEEGGDGDRHRLDAGGGAQGHDDGAVPALVAVREARRARGALRPREGGRARLRRGQEGPAGAAAGALRAVSRAARAWEAKPGAVEEVLAEGARRARALARPVLDAARDAAGLGPAKG